MKVHEYQAKELFKQYGIPIPRARVAKTPQEAAKAAQDIGTSPVVLKAQIHAGGRGKGGGIKVIHDPRDVEAAASKLLGNKLVTPQTGPEGKPVGALLIEEGLDVQGEIYVGIVIDRSRACPVVLASAEGGMEIEKVAAENPEKVFTEVVDPGVGLRPFQANRIVFSLNIDPSLARKASGIILNLYRLFTEKDCSLAEINPLVVTEGKLIALDAKLNFDDNALYRHPDISSLRDTSQEDPLEVEASQHRLNYIKLKGNVGCMVNGAGLAMATMDLIKLVGAQPANFLDVGGGATVDMIKHGLRILLSDPEVKVIFINIFGGILRCDTLARGVAEAAKELEINLPMVIRLEGTNVELGRQILADSGLRFTVAEGMGDAAQKVADLVNQL
ncbi:MAG: ADP-forming succinate--CoA ligase subunit beta [Deltaproteobacteria bacterium]|nr:MAG: ADP-forming succinate--CoA ligase subunit beta [Deltaproteobacteria bacterium]